MELWSTVEESYLLDFAEECPLLPLHAEYALTSAAAMNEPLELRQAPRGSLCDIIPTKKCPRPRRFVHARSSLALFVLLSALAPNARFTGKEVSGHETAAAVGLLNGPAHVLLLAARPEFLAKYLNASLKTFRLWIHQFPSRESTQGVISARSSHLFISLISLSLSHLSLAAHCAILKENSI